MTYLYALRALRRGVVPASESAWLHAIARNVCRWQHRTAARRPVADSSALETLASPEHEDARDFLNELPDALDSLPERQRHALLLREWRGLSADEIAQELELSAPATHALITRARRSLAHALTAPGRAAAGLGTLVYEARSWIKAAIGGLSAKAAATTVAVVGVGLGGSLAVDQTLADDRAGSRPAGDTPAVVESGGASPDATGRASLASVGGWHREALLDPRRMTPPPSLARGRWVPVQCAPSRGRGQTEAGWWLPMTTRLLGPPPSPRWETPTRSRHRRPELRACRNSKFRGSISHPSTFHLSTSLRSIFPATCSRR